MYNSEHVLVRKWGVLTYCTYRHSLTSVQTSDRCLRFLLGGELHKRAACMVGETRVTESRVSYTPILIIVEHLVTYVSIQYRLHFLRVRSGTPKTNPNKSHSFPAHPALSLCGSTHYF